jgi:hypothetical protein
MSIVLDPKAYENEINQFFDETKDVPNIFKNGKKLREEYYKRETFLRKISNCSGCEIVQFRAFFILKLLENIKEPSTDL